MTVPWEDLPHTVYQYFDGTGQLLYVGCTSNMARRETGHHPKPWWPEVARRETESFINRFAGLIAEQALIEYLQPLHNIQRKIFQSNTRDFELGMAIAREPHRIAELIADSNYRHREAISREREAAEAEVVMWKRTQRRLRESKFRAEYLADMRDKHERLARAS